METIVGEGWKAGDQELDAIAAARNSDPFAVLGPHETPAGWVIRVFAPDAISVRALTRDGALIAELPRRKNDIFEALIPSLKERPTYRVEVTTAQGCRRRKCLAQHAYPTDGWFVRRGGGDQRSSEGLHVAQRRWLASDGRGRSHGLVQWQEDVLLRAEMAEESSG